MRAKRICKILYSGLICGMVVFGTIGGVETENLPNDTYYEREQGITPTGTDSYYSPAMAKNIAIKK